MNIEKLIMSECRQIGDTLCEKNRHYGNSALEPKRIFSRANPIEQLNVRIDDKLSRIASGQADDTEDTEFDLIGYLILKRVALKVQGQPHGEVTGEVISTTNVGENTTSGGKSAQEIFDDEINSWADTIIKSNHHKPNAYPGNWQPATTRRCHKPPKAPCNRVTCDPYTDEPNARDVERCGYLEE